MQQQATVPLTAKAQRATVKAADYGYKFPATPRKMGGGFAVAEGARRLSRFYHTHMLLMRSMAGWLIQIPEFEVKVELGHHIYLHAEAARLLRLRCRELVLENSRLKEIPTDLKTLEQELLLSDGPQTFLNGIEVITTRLKAAEDKYVAQTDQLLDLPSIRVLRHIKLDLDDILSWTEAAVFSYVRGGFDEGAVKDSGAHIDRLLDASGGVDGSADQTEMPLLRQNARTSFKRSIACRRDERFTTFHDTRDYRKADDIGATAQTEYETDRLELVRVQRDEIDAIETFANVLFDFEDADFDLQMDLARFIWDEARHAEIGHQELERLGLQPFSVPCGIVGINVRSPLKPEIALAQISIFGELNIVGPMRRLSDRASEIGDRQTHLTFDFIHSDELQHLRRGRKWLKVIPPGDLKLIGEEARVQAIRRLLEEGVVREEYALNLTGPEIAALIGGE